MISPKLKQIFQKGSRTYFYSSLFFPPKIRADVTTLYAFVRVADNYVDQESQDLIGFNKFWESFYDLYQSKTSHDPVINAFYELSMRKSFNLKWIKAFENSMRSDFSPNVYSTLDDTLAYIYGSAEVIGLMMAKILDVDSQAFQYATMLGRAMQYANFIRDIDEDLSLNRCYFPREYLDKYQLSSLNKDETTSNPEKFKKFIDEQCSLYFEWQQIAESGYKFLPKYSLTAIRTSAQMYKWTVSTIQKDPFIVYRKKVKPSIAQIILTALKK